MVKRLVVIGAGISGLAAAHAARARSGEIDIVVLEKEPQVGGKARSLHIDQWRLEAGPTAYLDNEPILDRLIAAAGLEEQCLPASASAAHRFLLRGGRLREVHAHPLRFATSGILGPAGLLRIGTEPFIRRRREGGDEAVFDFASRRLGRQAAERLIAPMVLGIFAGDARRLSLPAAFPKLAELEREHGSLLRGMLAKRRAGALSGGPAGPAGRMTSFRDGMQSLPIALAERGDFQVRTGVSAQGLNRNEKCWRISLGGADVLTADSVILATEPWAMAELLQPIHARMAETLSTIHCPAVSVVSLGLPKAACESIPPGFGVLIPREEGFRTLGCLWDSHLFPGRNPVGGMLIRLMFGGSLDEEVASLDEDELIYLAREEVARLFGIRATPMLAKAIRWPQAIPQYEIGHGEKIACIEESLHATPGLFLAGNGLYGIAFGRSAATGYGAGEQAAHYLGD